MSATKIEWTDRVWNPIRGCTKVSEGCRNCYAERMAARYSGEGLPYEVLISGGRWNGRVRFIEKKLAGPLRWKNPCRVFVNSMSDLFHENVPDEWLDSIFAVMALAPKHTFQVLTKRPERMVAYLMGHDVCDRILTQACRFFEEDDYAIDQLCDIVGERAVMKWPLKNIWLGVSAENQEAADKRIPLLLRTPASVRWVSAEPLIGAIGHLRGLIKGWCPTHDFDSGFCHGPCKDDRRLDWVVCGGESGPGARPMHPDWARILRDQCSEAGVPFMFKQWGEYLPFGQEGAQCGKIVTHDGCSFYRCGKKRAGCLFDGREHKEYPESRAAGICKSLGGGK